jgi:hypothetical protein
VETRAAPSPYFVNLPVDFLLIGGASMIFYLLMREFHSGVRTERIIWWGVALSWVVNWPHFSATSYRLYSNTDHLRQYPVTAIAAPILMAAAVFGSFASPLVIAPYFVKLFLIWSPYHFSGQSIGISLLYARRGQHKVESAERFTLSGFIYGTFLVNSLRADVGTTGYEYYGVKVPGFGLPACVPSVAQAWMYTCGLIFLVLLARSALQERKVPPLMYLVPGLTQYTWFVLGGYGTTAGFTEFVPFFHSLQYLLIAWAMQLKERADREHIPGTVTYVSLETLRWYVLNFVGGVILFWALPTLAEQKGGMPHELATAVLICAVQIHHFFVDGVIWKLKTKSVVSPLLVNVPTMVRDAQAAPPSGALA